jgi:hypothetical protein
VKGIAVVVPSAADDPAADERLRRVVNAVAGVVEQLRALLVDIERLELPPGSCSLGWGVCPEHGDTLETVAGRSRCTACGTEWDHDREHQHCREPVAYLLGMSPVCRAHAAAAPPRSQLTPIATTT